MPIHPQFGFRTVEVACERTPNLEGRAFYRVRRRIQHRTRTVAHLVLARLYAHSLCACLVNGKRHHELALAAEPSVRHHTDAARHIGAFLHHEAAARARADVSAAVPDEVLQFRRSLRLKIFLDGRRRTTGHNQQFDLVQSTRSYGIAVKQSKIHLRRCVHETEPFHTPIASRPCSRIHADLYRFRRNNDCR